MKRQLTLIALVALALCAAASNANAALTPPAYLADATRTSETPDPICGVCSIVIKPKSSSNTDSSRATVLLKRDKSFSGDVELVLFRFDGTRATVLLPNVSLPAGETIALDVQEGSTWRWSEIELVDVRWLAPSCVNQ